MRTAVFCLVLLFIVGCLAAKVQHRLLEKPSLDGNESGINTTHAKINGKLTELIRNKRGWGSVLFHGASLLIKTTSLGLTLAGAISEGCAFYPSICSNKKEIERLDNLIKTLTHQYEIEYTNVKKTYYDVKTATTNNGYIEYYINHTMQMVETLQDIEEDLCAQLELKLPTLSRMYTASKNYTFEQYLGTVIGQLEYRLSDLKNMLVEHKRNALLGIVVQYLVETTLNKFVKSFKTAYETVETEDILATTKVTIWERLENPEVTLTTKPSKFIKVKLVPKTMKQMVKNVGQRMRDFGRSVKKWRRIKSWKGFKGKLLYTFRKPINKLKAIKRFFVDPSARTKFAQGYRLQWSQKIMMGIGMVADVVSQAVSIKQWATVSAEMEKARKNYEQYHSKLQAELKSINDEKKTMDQYWLDLIEVFRNLSVPFKSLVENSTNYSNFSDVIGLPRLPVDTSTPLFTINYDRINKHNIQSNQLAVVNFLKTVDNNMSAIEDQMRARLVLYNNTLSKSNTDEPILDMLSDVSSILNFSPSMTMKEFGQKLKMKDMVCTVSILRSDMTEYDFYPLDEFRPRCEVNTTSFEKMKTESAAKRKSKLMLTVVLRNMNSQKEESLSRLLDVVHSAYSGVRDKSIAHFGASITNRDIICLIAKEFPTHGYFDFIHLDPFRPSCSAVTNGKLSKMLQDADKLRGLTKGIQNDVKTCKSYGFCPCLSQVAKTHHTNEADIVNVLSHVNPPWTPNKAAQFCGPSGCGCRHL